MSQRSQPPSQPTSREALASIDPESLRGKVYNLIRESVDGATDSEVERALGLRHQTASARRRELVQLGLVVDSGTTRATDSGRQAIVWVAQEVSGMVVQPENPLDPTQRGHAMSAIALLLHTFTGTPRRLLWCVDLTSIPGTGPQQDPSEPDTGPWGELLERFKGALDRQRHVAQRCELGMVTIHECPATKRRIQATYSLPMAVDLTVLAGRPISAGVWRLWPVPDKKDASTYAGDQTPDIWWYDQIPF